MLRGRAKQCRLIDALIAEVRSGRSRVMVLRGEPGIGKSALMQYAAETGPDFHVARASWGRVGNGTALRRGPSTVQTDAG